jgi:flavin reductase (DIM6/NTAB) family NADH-FMN oxidoreductase RutF
MLESNWVRAADSSKAYLLLEAGPTVLVTTSSKWRANVMTMGFHMVVQHAPPLIGCIIGPWDYSYKALRATEECVIAIPTVDLAKTVVDIGNCSGRDVDKFERFGLTPVPATEVGAPLIKECLANIECRVVDTGFVKRYSLWVLEAAALWVDDKRKERRTLHHNGDGTFTVDGRKLDLRKRMVLWKEFQVDL